MGYLFLQLSEYRKKLGGERAQMMTIYGENRKIPEGSYDKSLAVTCENGTFVGKTENGVFSYKGIPYAMPPTGSLRWKRPVDPEPDTGIYEAYYYGKSGIQTEADTERASFYPQGEDCLTLNIWSSSSPADESTSPKAVMVFFPGGGFGWGGTADPLYDGQNFAEAHGDIVLVTVNYRIGLMGFIDFSEVEGAEEYKESGNLGLLDQICALRWIRRNISKFGGDPDNVTIFGESAGASSVSLLPLIKEAGGLFRRVIAQSGSLAFSFSREESRSLTRMLMKEAKASSMKDLLALSEEDLMRVNRKLNDYNNFPVRDGIVLPEDLYDAYASGAASGVDMLTGTNADEARYWIHEVGGYPVYRLAGRLLYGSIRERMEEEDRVYADAFLALQREQPIWAMTEFLNDLVFRVPAVQQAQLHSQTGGTHYMYYWTKKSEIAHYGACHAVELSYVFNNLDDTIFTGKRADAALAQTVQEMWVNFARTGDPSTGKYHWEKYDPVSRQTMVLGDETVLVSDPLREQRVLVEPLLKYRFNGYYKSTDYALIYLRNKAIRTLLILLGVNLSVYLLYRLRKRLKHRK